MNRVEIAVAVILALSLGLGINWLKEATKLETMNTERPHIGPPPRLSCDVSFESSDYIKGYPILVDPRLCQPSVGGMAVCADRLCTYQFHFDYPEPGMMWINIPQVGKKNTFYVVIQ